MPLLIYTVQPNDSLWRIANLYGSSIQSIAEQNNLENPNLIVPGQTLLIPVDDNLWETPPGSIVYTVQPGDTLYMISLLFQVGIEDILALNPIPNPSSISPGMLIVLPPDAVNPFQPVRPGIIRYRVLPGDSLYRIASRFGTSIQSIVNENPGLDPERIFPDQVITVPVPVNAEAIYRGNPNRRRVALTFDATYGDNQTERLLQILRENDIKATFFLSGIWPLNYPDLARAIVQEGHEIGNHSLTHPHMTRITPAEAANQLVRANAFIQAITGAVPYLFRPPFGEYNQRLLNIAARLGFLTIMWTVDSLDWQNPGAAQIANRVVNNAVPGAIILMHQAAYQTPEALPDIISRLRQSGYGFGTVTDVLNP